MRAKRNRKAGSISFVGGVLILFWVLISLLAIPLLLICLILTLAVFGLPLTVLIPIVTYFSPRYRQWLQTKRGYIYWLHWVPGLQSDRSGLQAFWTGAYLAVLTSLSLPLLWTTITQDVSAFTVFFALSLLCGLLIYGFLIHGWFTPSLKAQKAPIYFQRIKKLNELKQFDPVAFERYIGGLFKLEGYDVKTTPRSGDNGIDLILTKQRRTRIVQCKRYKATVGAPVVRELYGTMKGEKVEAAYLVTTGRITRQARQWADGKPIHLIDGNALIEWIEKIDQAHPEPILEPKISQR